MRVKDSFSKSSSQYRDVNSVQKLVAKKVIEDSPLKAPNIIDLGAGDGEVYRQLNWKPESFLAIDLSEKMLQKHNRGDEVETLCKSFDSDELWQELENREFDLIFSSSAFQWSRDLKTLFQKLQKLNRPFSIALFSSETFKELHEHFEISSPLYSSREIESFAEIFKNPKVSSREYSLQFNSGRELLQYIRNSGVSGGLNRVSIEALRKFIREEPFKELSFKVVFINLK